MKLETLVTSALLLWVFAGSANAAEPVLLADTNATPNTEEISAVVSIGERIVFARPDADGTQVFAIDGTSIVELGRISGREPTVLATDGLALFSNVPPTPGLITDGTLAGTREAQLGRSLHALTRLDDRWVFWEESVDGHSLWALSAGSDVTRLTTQAVLPTTTSVDGLAYFMGTSCELLSTDGYDVEEVLGPVEAVTSGPIPLCEVSRFGRDELLIHRRDTNRVWVTEQGRSQLRQLDWIDYGYQFTSAADGALVWDQQTLRYTDGTESGTIDLQSLFSAPLQGAFRIGDRTFLQPYRGGIWTSDGTPRGTSHFTQSNPVGPLTTDRSFVYWTTTGGAIWRMDSESTTQQIGAVPSTGVRGTAATSNGVYVWDDLYIWRLTEEAGVTEVWPAGFPQQTVGADPVDIIAAETFAVFLSKQGTELEELRRDRWQTYGTPESTTPVGNLLQRSRVLTADQNDRLLVHDGSDFKLWTPQGVSVVDDQREFAEGEANLGSPSAIAGPLHTYVFDVVFHVQYVDIVVSIVEDDTVRSVSRIRASTLEALEPFTYWIAENGRLIVTASDTCRQWAVAPDGTTEFRNVPDCPRAAPVPLDSGSLEVRSDGIWFVDGETTRSIQGGLAPTSPVTVDGVGYFIRPTLDDSGELELAQTDGTVEGTSTAFVADAPLHKSFLRVHRGVVYVRTQSPWQLYALIPGQEAVAVTPVQGDGKMTPYSDIAFLGSKAIYAGDHAELGSEPFAVEVPLNDPDRYDDESGERGGALTGGGCTSAPANPAGALAFGLMFILGVVGRRRRDD